MKTKMKKKILALILSLVCVVGTTGQAFAENPMDTKPLVNETIEHQKEEIGIEIGEATQIEEYPLDDSAEQMCLNFNSSEDEEENVNTKAIQDVSGLVNIQEIEEWDGSEISRATLPDIKVGTITALGTQPLLSNTNIKFEIGLSNIGSASATNVEVSIYIDEKLRGQFVIEGTLGAGTSGTFYFSLSKLGGTHTMRVVANENRAITESNYNNNSTATTSFRWSDCIALSADFVKPADGSDECVVREEKLIQFTFTNRGNITAEDVNLTILANNQFVKSVKIDVPSMKQLTITYPFNFLAHGNYTIAMSATPTAPQKDITPDNDAKSHKFKVNYDLDDFAGRWKSAKSLDVLINEDFRDFYSDTNIITVSQATAAINKWNGITSDVSLKVSTDDSKINDIDIVVIPYNGPEGELGYTQLYKTGQNDFEEIKNVDIYNDKGPYTVAVVGLNIKEIPYQELNYRLRTLTHEVGHALGLAHPACNDVALMRQTKDPLMSFSLEGHDISNLQEKY